MIVSGSILNNDMKIIPFANVVVVGENRSTSADADGKFSIQVNGLTSILRFSHAGYDYDEVSASEFAKFGYINLFPTSLDEASVTNNYHKTDTTLLWILGIAIAGAITLAILGKQKQPVKVKA